MALQAFSSHYGFRAKPVEAIDERRAFALVSLTWPRLQFAEWGEMVAERQRAVSGQGLWIAIEDLRDYIHALFFCQLTISSGSQTVLRVSDIIVAELPGRPVILSAIECVVHLAWSCGATAIDFDLEESIGRYAMEMVQDYFRREGWAETSRTASRFYPRFN
ncbi:MAG: hypothetical protein AB7F96_04855 [Beijerinckiaceae bacterium]